MKKLFYYFMIFTLLLYLLPTEKVSAASGTTTTREGMHFITAPGDPDLGSLKFDSDDKAGSVTKYLTVAWILRADTKCDDAGVADPQRNKLTDDCSCGQQFEHELNTQCIRFRTEFQRLKQLF